MYVGWHNILYIDISAYCVWYTYYTARFEEAMYTCLSGRKSQRGCCVSVSSVAPPMVTQGYRSSVAVSRS